MMIIIYGFAVIGALFVASLILLPIIAPPEDTYWG